METKSVKYIIIGAGLSGLATAYELFRAGETDFLVLESRNRIGGRIMTFESIDFGATWFQNHHGQVIRLLRELQLDKFHQYTQGKSVLVYSSMAPEHYFESDPNAPTAYRIKGGSDAVIQALARHFPQKIQLGMAVTGIIERENSLAIETNSGTYFAEKVICTIPPKIALRVRCTPELPEALKQVMDKTHTWMSNAIKVGLTFESPFWRVKKLSGTIIGQVGAVTELYDHTTKDETYFALMGFVNEGLRDCSTEERKKRILEYLSKYLGPEIMHFKTYEEKDWSQDEHTSCETIKSVYMSPAYGNPVFEKMYFGNKLLFSGAETSPVHGGYMDGAIYSASRAAKKVLD